jgi:hypothetical protein
VVPTDQPDDTSELLRSSLERRLKMAAQEEERLTASIASFQQQLKAVRQRREAAAKLFALEFGDEPSVEPRAASAALAEPMRDEVARTGPLTGLPWAEAMRRVLADAGRPLHVKEIWRALAEGGFATASRDPLRSIVAVALRTDGVVRADPNTYGLAEHLFDDGPGVSSGRSSTTSSGAGAGRSESAGQGAEADS